MKIWNYTFYGNVENNRHKQIFFIQEVVIWINDIDKVRTNLNNYAKDNVYYFIGTVQNDSLWGDYQI